MCHLLKHLTGGISKWRVSFISASAVHDPENHEDEDESEDDFQKRVGEAVWTVESSDWGGSSEQKHLDIIEGILRDCRTIDMLPMRTS